VKTWQALYAMFLPERSGFGLNELLAALLILLAKKNVEECQENEAPECDDFRRPVKLV